MERNRIIKKVESDLAFLLVVVSKKKEGVKLCVNYQKLN